MRKTLAALAGAALLVAAGAGGYLIGQPVTHKPGAYETLVAFTQANNARNFGVACHLFKHAVSDDTCAQAIASVTVFFGLTKFYVAGDKPVSETKTRVVFNVRTERGWKGHATVELVSVGTKDKPAKEWKVVDVS